MSDEELNSMPSVAIPSGMELAKLIGIILAVVIVLCVIVFGTLHMLKGSEDTEAEVMVPATVVGDAPAVEPELPAVTVTHMTVTESSGGVLTLEPYDPPAVPAYPVRDKPSDDSFHDPVMAVTYIATGTDLDKMTCQIDGSGSRPEVFCW